MRETTSQAWKDLVYNLIYPGVLGSMIFDIADPLRKYHPARLGLFFIALAFITDYWHMKHNLKVQESVKALPAYDGAIALFFSIAYFALSRVTAEGVKDYDVFKYCFISNLFLTSTYVCVFLYEDVSVRTFATRDFRRIVPATPCFVLLILMCLSPVDPVTVTILASFFSFVAYSMYVYLYNSAASEGEPQPPSNMPTDGS